MNSQTKDRSKNTLPEGVSSPQEIWKDVLGNAFKFVFLVLGVYLLVRIVAAPIVYTYLIENLSSHFGVETIYVYPFAIGLTALIMGALPMLIGASFFGYNAEKATLILFVASLAFALLTYFFTKDVYFDRDTGEPRKCYAMTQEGVKYSSTCGYDPKLGIRFQPITHQKAKELDVLKKNGGMVSSDVVKGKYFNPLTGEAVTWYVIHPDYRIQLFSSPGFDPATGEILRPITLKIVQEYENQQRKEAEEKIALEAKNEAMIHYPQAPLEPPPDMVPSSQIPDAEQPSVQSPPGNDSGVKTAWVEPGNNFMIPDIEPPVMAKQLAKKTPDVVENIESMSIEKLREFAR